MIEICKLTKRQVDPSSKELTKELQQVKIFSLAVGHGIGTVDFMESIGKIEEDEYQKMLDACGEYARFKLGNISQYFEVEVFAEHAALLHTQMPECFLKETFASLKEGYIVLRKAI